MSHWDFGRPSAEQDDQPPAGRPFEDDFLPGQQASGDWDSDRGGEAGGDWTGGDWNADDDPGPYPIIYERDPYPVTADRGEPDEPGRAPGQPGRGAAGSGNEADEPFPTAEWPAPGDRAQDARTEWENWALGRQRRLRRRGPGDRGSRRARGGRRWLVPAGIAVAAAALGATAVLLTGGHPGSPSASGSASTRGRPSGGASGGASGPGIAGSQAAPSPATSVSAGAAPPESVSPVAGPPLSLAAAQAVVAGYTTANNAANAERSAARLAAIETGSSDAIDAALYQAGKAAGTTPYPPFGPAQATYYLPRGEPAAGPRWFVVQVANALTASPAKVISTEYLLFTQPAPGQPWRNAIEPYLVPGASAPRISLGADGLASAVSPDSAAQTVNPGLLPAVTAAALDGTLSGQPAVAAPGNLADSSDLRLWRKDVPSGTVTDTHAAATGTDGQEFALAAVGGGALVFYTDAAQLTVTPPAGSLLHVSVPGFYSPSQPVTMATVSYLEQFAAYDPPSGDGAPRVVADYSAITGRG